jgi:hypothetical protein
MTITNGHLLGPRVRYPQIPGLTATQMAFTQGDTRGVLVPPALSPRGYPCEGGGLDTRQPGCIEPTPTGDYFPPAYVLPALAIKVSHDTVTALWLSRLASAIPCVILLVLAVALLWDGAAWSLLGLLLAVSPMVLFLASILNPSGLEVAASAALAAAVLRITRAPARVRPWLWTVVALTTVLTVLAWQAGPAFALADLALGAGLLGSSGLRGLAGTSRRAIWTVLALLVAAGVAWLVYSRVSNISHTPIGVSPLWPGLDKGLAQLGPVLRDSVGTFGALTVHLPWWAHWAWWLAVLTLLGVAVLLGEVRERVVLALTVLVALVFPVLAYAWVQRHSGFGMQGRHVLPILMLIPLAGGEVVNRHRVRFAAKRPAQVALAGAIAGAAFIQGYGWWLSARSASGAPTTIRFWSHAIWSPPAGWTPWLLAAGLGTALLIGLAGAELVSDRVPRHRRLQAA